MVVVTHDEPFQLVPLTQGATQVVPFQFGRPACEPWLQQDDLFSLL
jgi:hypothetical protein